MQTFKIVDCTLTEGHLNQFCNFTLKEKCEFLILLNSFGIEYVEINVLNYEEYETFLKLKKDKCLKIKFLLTFANIADIDILEKCSSYQIDSIKLQYGYKINDTCNYIKNHNSNIEIVLEISINDFYSIVYWPPFIDRIRIVDTCGTITHYEIEEVWDLIQDSMIDDLKVEYQFRNDTSSAVYNSYMALFNGCGYISLSVLGIGNRNGITDLSGFISRIYGAHKDILQKYDLTVLKSLDEFVSCRLGTHIPMNNPITGICSWDSVNGDDFTTNIIFTQTLELFKTMMEHILPDVCEKLTDTYISKLYDQICKDISKDTALFIKINSDVDYARRYIYNICS